MNLKQIAENLGKYCPTIDGGYRTRCPVCVHSFSLDINLNAGLLEFIEQHVTVNNTTEADVVWRVAMLNKKKTAAGRAAVSINGTYISCENNNIDAFLKQCPCEAFGPECFECSYCFEHDEQLILLEDLEEYDRLQELQVYEGGHYDQ